MKKLTLSIGIPAHNEEANIGHLMSYVLRQKTPGFVLKEIIVSSDGSTDKTVQIVNTYSDRRIKLFANRNRQGLSRGLNQIIDHSHGDVLVLLDADVRIYDPHFIEKLVKPITDSMIDLTAASIRELPPRTFFVQMLAISMHLKDILFTTFKHGQNIYTCKGPARAFSRRFYTHIRFPRNAGVDRHSYLDCISGGFNYKYVPEAVAYYQLPQNISDHRKQSLRFFSSLPDHEKQFPKELVKDQLNIPLSIYIQAGFKALPVLIRHPLHSLAYFFLQLYLRIKSAEVELASDKWEMAVSSKRLV